MTRICVMVSGGGTNLQALIDAQGKGIITSGKIVLVIASNNKSYALQRAEQNGIEHCVVSKKQLGNEFDSVLLKTLEERKIDMIVLAGYLSILSANVVAEYTDRILNIHPALIPSFCGEGYYGLRVHQAVLDYGVKVTGATVHYVNEVPDGGAIIAQKAVTVLEGDTAEILQKRVMEQAEWKLLPPAVEMLAAKLLSEPSS